jgi:hypothetical protein
LIKFKITVSFFIFFSITVKTYGNFYTEHNNSGFYSCNPKSGFYATGINKTFELIEEKTNEVFSKTQELMDRIKTMSAGEIAESISNTVKTMVDDPSSIDAAENYILYKVESARRKMIAEQSVKDAIEKLKEEKEYTDPSDFNDINKLKKDVRLGFFLSYSTPEREENSKFGEALIEYYYGEGFRIFIVVPSFAEKMDISEKTINKIPDIIVDNDGMIASEFGVKEWPECVGFEVRDGAIFNLYSGKEYVEKINDTLLREYKTYLNGGDKEFKHINFTR